MIPTIRKRFNDSFNPERYQAFLHTVFSANQHQTPFRIAETPVFIPLQLKHRLEAACEEICEVLCQPDFKQLTKDAIKHPSLQVPGEEYESRFLQLDFGICLDSAGDLTPQLIELQGFPSLYFFQDLLASSFRQHYDIPTSFPSHLNGMSSAEYIALLKKIIIGGTDPRQVVLLEIEPEKQNTYIDFLEAEKHLGLKILCITHLKKRGKQLFYLDEEGKEVPIVKIYNRVIFDELAQREDLKREFYFADEVEVEWIGHPNWFFRISKYTMPMLSGDYVPKSYYLDRIDEYPQDLDQYVLKPLYSFSGAGVKINVTKEDLDAIADRDNYILQHKVQYAPAIDTPSGPAKCEIRMMMLWEQGEARPRIVNNLIRLSKGEMVGVRYNKDKDWVGASVGFYEVE